VLARFHCRKLAVACQREREQKLIRQVRSGVGCRLQIPSHPPCCALRELFSWHAEFAETADDLVDVLKFSFEKQNVTRALLLGKLTYCKSVVGPVEQLAHRFDFTVGDLKRQGSKYRKSRARNQLTALNTVDWFERRRPDVDLNSTAATRIEAVPHESGLDLRSHPPNDGQKALLDEVEGGRDHVVRGAFENEP
jgi:hypothetical protein